jgi:hypothetical protein
LVVAAGRGDDDERAVGGALEAHGG